MGNIEQLAPTMPAAQTCKRIGPEQQHQRAFTKFPTQFVQRIDGVGRAAAIQFARIQHEPRLSAQCGTQHLYALLGAGGRRRTMRRHAGRHQPHFSIQQLGRFPGNTEMADMDRIEGAAEYRERFHAKASCITSSPKEQRGRGSRKNTAGASCQCLRGSRFGDRCNQPLRL